MMRYGLKSKMMRRTGKELKMVGMVKMIGMPVDAKMPGQKNVTVDSTAWSLMVW